MDTWTNRLVLRLSLQSGSDPLKSGPAKAGPAGPVTLPLLSPAISRLLRSVVYVVCGASDPYLQDTSTSALCTDTMWGTFLLTSGVVSISYM